LSLKTTAGSLLFSFHPLIEALNATGVPFFLSECTTGNLIKLQACVGILIQQNLLQATLDPHSLNGGKPTQGSHRPGWREPGARLFFSFANRLKNGPLKDHTLLFV